MKLSVFGLVFSVVICSIVAKDAPPKNRENNNAVSEKHIVPPGGPAVLAGAPLPGPIGN